MPITRTAIRNKRQPPTMRFDQGSYSTIRGEGTSIRITPYISSYGTFAWFAVKSDQWGGKIPRFLYTISNRFGDEAGTWLACWATSPDTDTWTRFDNVTVGASDIEFYHNTPFPHGMIYIAAHPMYPFARIERKVREWRADAYVSDTASSSSGIIGRSTGRTLIDGSGRVIPDLPYYGFKVSSGAGTKNNIILAGYNHSVETPGAFVFEGALDWLLAGSVLAEFLLDYCNFFVYPATNPQGVWAGWFRSSPQVPGTSHDWLWDAGSVGTDESVDAFKTAMNTDTGGAIAVGFDYHAYYANTDILGAVHTGNTTGNYAAYAAEMEVLDADWELLEMDLSQASANFFASLGGTAITIEQGMETGRAIADWKTYGENSLKALANMIAKGYLTNNPGVGSRSFNGTSDRIDWSSVSNLRDHAMTISLWVYIDTMPTNGYMFCVQQSGDAAVAMYFNVSTTSSNYVSFGVLGSSNMQRASDANNPTTGAWIHYIVTYAGTITDAAGVHIYRNNTECASYSVTTNGATSVTATGRWSIGGRYFDDNRNIDCKLAQVGVWDRVITSTERANLAAGYAPDLATSDPLFYFKGNTSSLANSVTGGSTGTADGTTQLTGTGNGPAIIYG
jgi:hypothetical protein